MKIVPAGETIAELERKAVDCEEQAKSQPEPEAAELRAKAKRYREWMKALLSGKWIP